MSMSNIFLQRYMIADGESEEISVEIDRPVRVAEMEYTCEFRIKKDASVLVASYAVGADEVQAVMIVFEAIRDSLKSNLPAATWYGLPIDIAFPRTIPYAAGVETYREIEEAVDEMLRARFG